jgi:hypothetical protein
MAASVTVSETRSGSVKKLKFAWTSAADGSASQATTFAYDGKIELLTTVPSGGGTAPSDNYDITLLDSDSVDVLAGAGLDRDATATEQAVSAVLGAVAGSKLTFTLANAGDSKQGTCYVYLR